MTRFGLGLWVLLGVSTCLFAAGCGRDRCDESAPDGGTEVDSTLLAFLSRARAAHHRADLYSDQPARALAVLEEITSGPLPGTPGRRPTEVREVLADTEARIASLHSELGHDQEAVTHVQRGLSQLTEDSYFRGHLYEVLGVVEQRRAERLAKAGQGDLSAQAKERALAAFERSMEINARVIQKAAPAPTAPKAPADR